MMAIRRRRRNDGRLLEHLSRFRSLLKTVSGNFRPKSFRPRRPEDGAKILSKSFLPEAQRQRFAAVLEWRNSRSRNAADDDVDSAADAAQRRETVAAAAAAVAAVSALDGDCRSHSRNRSPSWRRRLRKSSTGC